MFANFWVMLACTFIVLLGFLLFIPLLTLLIECLSALSMTQNKQQNQGSSQPCIAVLVPAHNEADGIQKTLESLIPQLSSCDRLVVIADNCTDETASIARASGVIVIERHEPDKTLRGKGYALDFGLQYLASNPPDVVVTVDADCLVNPTAVKQIAQQAWMLQRPVQACYLMAPPENASAYDLFSAFAIVLKNHVRPLGLAKLGLPNLLTGSGMAFPWSVIRQVSLAGSKTCDDMQSCIDLAIAGYPPTFCAEAQVTGRLMAGKAALSQRSRWEHGHLEMLMVEVPRLLLEAVKQRRFDLLALAFEVAVPPLSLVFLIWLIAACSALTLGLLVGIWLPLIGLALTGGSLAISLGVVWFQFEQFGLSLHQILVIPFYAFWKIPVYVGYLIKPQTRWLKTERDAATSVN